MTCVNKRLRIAYDNLAFYGNKTWINDSYQYTRMNQELYAKECKIYESEWTELVRPKTVQDVIPNSKLAQYFNGEYNSSRELSYRPTLRLDVSFHYPCLYKYRSCNEPWMLPEVEELFLMLTCTDTFNFMCYKKLDELPSLDLIDVDTRQSELQQYEFEDDFNKFSLLEDMFDRTPGKPCKAIVERTESMTPPLYKVATLDEMLMKMKLRFGNIRQIWSVSKGGTCPDRAMKVFKSPFTRTFVREKHHIDVRGIEMSTPFPHGKDARRIRNLREIRNIQKLAEALKELSTCVKLKQDSNEKSNPYDTVTPLHISEESSMPTRRLYSDVVQGLSLGTPKTQSIKSDYFSEYSSTPTNSSVNESYMSISSMSTTAQSPQSPPFHNSQIVAVRSATPPVNWISPEKPSSPSEEFNSDTHSNNQGSCLSTTDSSTIQAATSSNDVLCPINYNSVALNSNSRILECVSYPSTSSGIYHRPVKPPVQPQQPGTSFSTCYYRSYPCTPPSTNAYCTNYYPNGAYNACAYTSANVFTGAPQICTYRNNQPLPVSVPQPLAQLQTSHAVATRAYAQHQTQTTPSNGWFLPPQYPQNCGSNHLYSLTNYPSTSMTPYVILPSSTLIKTQGTSTNRWATTTPQPQQYIRPAAPPTVKPQVYHNTPTLWSHLNNTPGIYRANPISPQVMIDDPKISRQPGKLTANRFDSDTVLLRKTSALKFPSNPTSILIKPSRSNQAPKKMQVMISSTASTDTMCCEASTSTVPIVTSRSDDLERQALEEYHPSNETLLGEIERQAEEQYESSSENCLSPPSSDLLNRFYFRGAFNSILIN